MGYQEYSDDIFDGYDDEKQYNNSSIIAENYNEREIM